MAILPPPLPLTPTEVAARTRARLDKAAQARALHLKRLAAYEAAAYAALMRERTDEIDESPMRET
jgi:hypothetical protein